METVCQKNSTDIPVMFGYNSHEGIIMVLDVLKNKKFELYDKDLARFIPRSIDLDVNDPRCQQLANEMREFYFNGRNLTNKTIKELVHLMTDYHFAMCVHLCAELYALYQHRYVTSLSFGVTTKKCFFFGMF